MRLICIFVVAAVLVANNWPRSPVIPDSPNKPDVVAVDDEFVDAIDGKMSNDEHALTYGLAYLELAGLVESDQTVIDAKSDVESLVEYMVGNVADELDAEPTGVNEVLAPKLDKFKETGTAWDARSKELAVEALQTIGSGLWRSAH
jgi:hypothetical protein